MEIKRDVYSLQAYGCRFCLHIGSIALLFGRMENGRGPRVEICTPARWFRWSWGYVDKPKIPKGTGQPVMDATRH